MEFVPVNLEDIPQSRGREGRVSTDLIRSFLDSGTQVALVEVGDTDKKMESVRATVGSYVRRHEHPVRVFTAGGKLYLQRDDSIVEQYRELNEKADAKAKEKAAADAAALARGEKPAPKRTRKNKGANGNADEAAAEAVAANA